MNHVMLNKSSKLFFTLLLSLMAVKALAEPPNIVGTLSGSLTGLVFGVDDSVGTSAIENVILTVSSQQPGNVGDIISGSISLSPSGLNATFNGQISDNGTVSLSFNDSSTVVGVSSLLTGTFNGTTLTVPINGLILQSTTMSFFDLAGTLSFSGAADTSSIATTPEETASTSIRNSGTIRTEILGVTAPIQQHLVKSLHGPAKGVKVDKQSVFIEGEGGLNAGDIQLGNIGIWASYNYRSVENDFSRTAFESNSHTGLLGIDFSPNKNLIIGLAIAYENSETDTLFNNGELETDGYTVSPYFGYLLNDNWSLDASLGVSFIDNEQFRITSGNRITSNPDTDRFFFNANLNGISYIDNWVIGGRVGVLFAKSNTEAFTESDGSTVGESRSKLSQIRIGTDVAYSFGEWEPYISALYEYDFQLDEIEFSTGAQPANDRDDLLLSGGFRIFKQNGLSANFDYSKRFLRDDFDEDSITFNVRYDF